MKRILIILGIIILAGMLYFAGKYTYYYIQVKQINTFDACVKAGYKITIYPNGTDPSKCTLPDGRELFDKVYGPDN